MKTEEDEAWEDMERKQSSGWRKKQVAEKVNVDMDPYATMIRNRTIEEVAEALMRFEGPFGRDTVESFAIYVRGMKK